MNITDIIQAINANYINVTQHARKEAREDELTLDEILFSTCHGKLSRLIQPIPPTQVV